VLLQEETLTKLTLFILDSSINSLYLPFQVCYKGPNIFKGYLYDDEKTKEAFDEDGWLHSGDIGIWLPNGTLKIVDRRKNIFKLSQVCTEYLDRIPRHNI
jgi:acyl-CoA synthetase (AMP-forming)/AMP-acid ligase II